MKITMKSAAVAALTAITILSAAPALAQFPPKPLVPLVMTSEAGPHHFSRREEGNFRGRRLAYKAELSETIVKDAAGKPAASLFAFSYAAEGVKAPAARPVIFAFNGGPGASSAFVHFDAIGPKIKRDSQKPGEPLTANPLSPLDVADLVFLDPPETGYSRILPGADRSQFASIDGDSAAMAQVVVNWLREHGRLHSPVYLYGESYGTMRAVAMARDLRRGTPGVNVAGLMLGGNSLGYFQKGQMPDILFAANALPMMASVAWYHGKIDRTQSWSQAVDKARLFARTDYIAALMQGYRLDPAERDRVIDKLPAIIGIPAENFRKRSSIVPGDFKGELLADRGLVVDGDDGRITRPASAKYNRLDVSEYDTIVDSYAASTLNATGLGHYKALNPVLNPQWNYYTSGAMALDVTLAQEMKGNPNLRILLVQGRYDTLTTIGNSEYIMRQADLDWNRFSVAYYDGGHRLLPAAEIMDGLRNFVSKTVN